MIAKTLALVNRALRSDARSIWPHIIRGSLACFVLALITLFYRDILWTAAPGRRLFSAIAYVNFWCITFAGASYFSTAITEEKEERTLGLLHLAGLSPISVLLGKWLPRMIGAALVLAIQIPFTMLCVTLGGLTWEQVFAVYVALFSHLVFAGCIGLLASVVFRTTGQACTAALATIILSLAIPFALLVWTNWVPSFIPRPAYTQDRLIWTIFGPILEMSAGMRILEIMEISYAGSIITWQFYANLTLGLVLFAASWLLFGVCTANEGEATGESFVRRWRKRLRMRPVAQRAWRLAIVGKDFHELTWGVWGILMRFAIYGGVSAVFIVTNGSYSYRDPFLVCSEILGGVGLLALIFEAGALAARVFRNEITNQTWSTLCMLPRSLGSIAYAKILGGLTALIPGVTLVATAFVLHQEPFWEVLEELLDDDMATFALFLYFLAAVLLALHLAALVSISGRWGVWPVAMALGAAFPLLTLMMILEFLNQSFTTAVILFLLCQFVLLATVGLHFRIRRRLEQLAGE